MIFIVCPAYRALLACAAILLAVTPPVSAQSLHGLEGLPNERLNRMLPDSALFSPGVKLAPAEEVTGENGKTLPTDDKKIPSDSPEADEAAAAIPIRQIRVEGVNRLSTDEVASVTAAVENTSKTLEELDKAVIQPLTALYQKKGLVTSSVYIPPQTLTAGILVIRADEGTVGEVVLEEGEHFKKRAILPRLGLRPGEPFNLERLENSLRRINENPDLHLSATLKAGAHPGETRIILRPTQDDRTFHISPFLDNTGRDLIGTNHYGVTLSNNNLLGFGDTLYTNMSFTNNSWGNSSGYEIPLGPHGTKVGFNYGLSHFSVEQAGFGFTGESASYAPYVTQELYRSANSTLTAELALGIKNSTLDLEDYTLNADRIRTLTPALSWVHTGKASRSVVRAEMGIGLDMFNATSADSATTSRPGAGSRFVRYTGYAVHAQKLVGNSYGVFKAMGQVTPSELVSLEQFQIGGASSIRGYKQGRLIGDSGFALTAELHAPLGFLPEYLKLAGRRIPLKNQIELIGFTDFGGVFDNNPFTGVNSQSNRVVSKALIGSTGAGLQINLTRKLAARIAFGIPLMKLPGSEPAKPQLHFSIESKLF